MLELTGHRKMEQFVIYHKAEISAKDKDPGYASLLPKTPYCR